MNKLIKKILKLSFKSNSFVHNSVNANNLYAQTTGRYHNENL